MKEIYRDRLPATVVRLSNRMRPLRWALARILFIGTAGLCLGSGVAGLAVAPLFTWWMYGDFRFWRHLRHSLRLYPYGYRVLGLMLRGDGAFLLGVPLLRADWEYDLSCGPCTRCCRHGRRAACPLLDESSGRCRGYDSFFWRYFNCGRFPTRQWDIDYYGCPKWKLSPPAVPALNAPIPLGGGSPGASIAIPVEMERFRLADSSHGSPESGTK